MKNNTLRVGSWNIGRSLSSKLQHILTQAIQLDIHILALQEIGEPTMYQHQVSVAGYQMYVCTHQYAGVALLVHKSMCPLIRQVNKREEDGRLIGIELQVGNETIVIMSAYMHSDIDFTADSDDIIHKSQLIYDNINKWSTRGSRVIVMGDMNETMSNIDREYNSSATHHARLITQLSAAGMSDVYRLLHPKASGFTHFTSTAHRQSKSRLDYIFTMGWSPATIHYCNIDITHSISHHRLIHTELEIKSDMKVNGKRVKVSVLNLIHASVEQKQQLVLSVDKELSYVQHWIRVKASGSRMDIDELAQQFTSIVYVAAKRVLDMTTQDRWKHKSVQIVSKQREFLSSLLHLAQQTHIP